MDSASVRYSTWRKGVTHTVVTAWSRADATARRSAAAYLREHGLNPSFAHLCKSRLLSRLLELLEEETILIIDLVTQRSMQVQISNISTNIQLSILIQHHLLLQYDADEVEVPGEWCPSIRKKLFQQADGSAHQSTVSHRAIPWDLLDHTAVVKMSTGPTAEQQERICFNHESKHWIWNEGTPADIPPCAALGGMRIVLLDLPSYPRTFSFVREFGKLVPKFLIVNFFGTEETADFLEKIAAESNTCEASASRAGRPVASEPSSGKATEPSCPPEADQHRPQTESGAPLKRWRLRRH